MNHVIAERGNREDAHRWQGKGVPSGQWEPNVVAPAVVTDAEGTPLLAIGRYPRKELTALRAAFRGYPMGQTNRRGGTGFRNRSTVFGYLSRDIIKQRDGCRACAAASGAAALHGVIADSAAKLGELFADLVPERARRDQERAAAVVHDEWRLPGSPWTSGVLNDTSPLPYHYDRNNLDTWSGMVVVRRGVRGGHLHVPELNLVVECRDGDVVFFAGWHWLHGVTPIQRTAKDGYRFTAVYYTVERMRHCLSPTEEMEWARRQRTTRESDLRDAETRLGV